MAPTSALTDCDARFAELLNPIRDLTKNWNIDLVAYLDLFLSEIEKISITFDDGKTSMNFAQAALLIQGSTCVYSKKVEFLYNLVLQMLDLLHSRRKAQQPTSIDAQGKDKDTSTLEKDTVDEFLSLDDIHESNNIEQKEDKQSKKKSVVCLPQIPGSLLALDDSEKGDSFLYTESGDLIGNKNDFKINTSATHSNGMLTLDSNWRKFLDYASNTQDKHVFSVPGPIVGESTEADRLQQDITEGDAVENDCPGPEAGDDFMDVDGPPPPSPPHSLTHTPPTSPPPLVIPEDADEEKYNLRKKKDVDDEIPPVTVNDENAKLLDPYSENPRKEAPMKKGKVARVLVELLNTPGLKRKRLDKESLTLEDISVFCNKSYFSDAMKLPKNGNKIPSFMDFEARFWEECKLRKSILKKHKAAIKTSSEVPAPPVGEETDKEEELERDDYDLFADGGGNDFQDFEDDEKEKRDCCEAGKQEEDLANVPTTYEELVKIHVDQYLASAQHHAQVTDLVKRVSEWEEKIMPVLEEEEKRGPFDIHNYGSKVLSCFANNNRKQTLKFGELAAGKEPYEVSRYFLSTLQLANSYNVEISAEGELWEGMDTMEVTLLSRKRHHEELNEYVAPSLNKDH